MNAVPDSKTTRCAPQGDAELMAKEQVLRFKPTRRLEEVDDEHCERMQERGHRPRSCDDSTRRGDSKPDGIFGKHNDYELGVLSRDIQEFREEVINFRALLERPPEQQSRIESPLLGEQTEVRIADYRRPLNSIIARIDRLLELLIRQ
jgi:hypothetical protein